MTAGSCVTSCQATQTRRPRHPVPPALGFALPRERGRLQPEPVGLDHRRQGCRVRVPEGQEAPPPAAVPASLTRSAVPRRTGLPLREQDDGEHHQDDGEADESPGQPLQPLPALERCLRVSLQRRDVAQGHLLVDHLAERQLRPARALDAVGIDGMLVIGQIGGGSVYPDARAGMTESDARSPTPRSRRHARRRYRPQHARDLSA